MKCPVCKTSMQPFLKKAGYVLFECETCDLKITDFNNDYESFVRKFYSKGYFTGSQKHAAYENYKEDKPFIKKNMQVFLDKIKKYKKNGKLLDVGCALGFLIEMANDQGYDAYGFDPSKYAIDEAKKLIGNRVKLGSIQSVRYPKNSFDIITLFDVFEHLKDPMKDTKKLRSLLKKNGIIVIATGDTGSLYARVFKRKWTFYNPPQHIYHFNKKNLTTVLTESGFTPLQWFKVGKWLSFGYVLHLARVLAESKKAQFLYKYLKKYPRILSLPLYLSLRDNMVVIAKK